MQDIVVEGHEAIRLGDGEIGIPTQGPGEGDHALHTVGGLMIMTRIGGGRNVPGQPVVVATPDRAN